MYNTLDEMPLGKATEYIDGYEPNFLFPIPRHINRHRIHHEGLLKYTVSFRQENDFSEQCVERFYQDILIRYKPEKLTVFARYTRRGGLDINPFRSNVQAESVPNIRDARQ